MAAEYYKHTLPNQSLMFYASYCTKVSIFAIIRQLHVCNDLTTIFDLTGTCGFRVMQADKQTYKQKTHHNTSQPFPVRNNNNRQNKTVETVYVVEQ